MEARGVELLAGLDDLSVMGFIEVLPRLVWFRRLERRLKSMMEAEPPDLVILVDFPGFNMRMARAAKGRGIPVLYYITPKVWAWRSKRARALADTTDRLAVILPFEEAFLEKFGAKATYVGNPLLDRKDDVPDRAAFCGRWGLDPARRILAVLPGSRSQELDRHLEVFVAIAQEVARERPDVVPVLSRARTMPPERFGDVDMPVVDDTRALLRHAEAALVKSGTSTLETALEETPFVIAYRTNPATMWLARRLVQVPYIGLPNLIMDEEVVPEFWQGEVTPEAVVPVLLELLEEDGDARTRQLRDLEEVRSRLGEPGAAARVADLASELLAGAATTERGEADARREPDVGGAAAATGEAEGAT